MIVKIKTMRWLFAVSHALSGVGGALTKACLALIVCLWAFQASAQQTYKAASCNQSDVQTAINNEIAHASDGDIITIPAGTCTWTGSSVGGNFTKSVTIQGAGAISATTGGASTTGTDQTVIINHTGTSVLSLQTTAGKVFQLTGIAFLEDSGSSVVSGGNVYIGGKSQSVRVDHCHFFLSVGGSKGLFIGDNVNGVADHIYINTTQTITNNFVFQNGGTIFSAGDVFGNGAWANPDNWGTSKFFYVEDTRMDGGYGGDCAEGGRYVLRHSTVVNNHGIAMHGTHDQYRGCRAAEAYLNTFTFPTNTAGGIIHPNSGTTLVWGNTVSGYNNAVDLNYYRITAATFTSPAPPNGWGMCPSVWDQNSACLDLPSRGQGDLITNYNGNFSTDVLNSSTGTRTWPRQALSPVYAWNNTLGGAGASAIVGNSVSVLQRNRDYYQQFGTFGEPGTFNGTAGIGQGPLAARPATCSAGPGGNTPGVGYWATDTNTLYVCNPTNNWTTYYTPFTYPHPLTGTSSASQTPATVAPPTGLSATVQ